MTVIYLIYYTFFKRKCLFWGNIDHIDAFGWFSMYFCLLKDYENTQNEQSYFPNIFNQRTFVLQLLLSYSTHFMKYFSKEIPWNGIVSCTMIFFAFLFVISSCLYSSMLNISYYSRTGKTNNVSITGYYKGIKIMFTESFPIYIYMVKCLCQICFVLIVHFKITVDSCAVIRINTGIFPYLSPIIPQG